ncbi:hypothetical protein K443DRAFT_676371 [Laccaria amethystina LaAM-08-1]|uniref:Uncharacterized protein n=1 Tax=Laccaria amethystina LaAM-08-1 TaxID=1095629 RepID=A0A0C9WW54_9AGAR|nr:hypothetical protein K443DRAFT_676371 [Laccaria amethystina LaAM-08-1]
MMQGKVCGKCQQQKMAACRYHCVEIVLHRKRCIGRPSKRPAMQHTSPSSYFFCIGNSTYPPK